MNKEERLKRAIENCVLQLKREQPKRDEFFRNYWGESMNNVVKTSDMVSVVRCKDCKHRVMHNNYGKDNSLVTKAHCELDTDDIFNFGRRAEKDDWFCADGERR